MYKGVCLFVMIFLFLPNVFSYEVVSNDYSVDSFSISLTGSETDLGVETRDVSAYESGGYFDGGDYYGEVKKLPANTILKEDLIPSGGGGSRGGGSIKLECYSNNDCLGELFCIEGNCSSVYFLEILDFKSPIRKGEEFEFSYFVERNLSDTVNLKTLFWIEDYRGNILISKDSDLYLLPYQYKTKLEKMYFPEDIDDGTYIFHLQLFDEKEIFREKSFRVEVKGEYIYFKDRVKSIVIIGFSSFVFLLLILFSVYYRKFIALWAWFKDKYLKGVVYRINNINRRIFKK